MKALIAVLSTVLVVPPAEATTGGELFLDIWGWHPEARGVIVHEDDRDASDGFGPVFLLRPGRPDSTIALPTCVYRGDDRRRGSPCESAVRALRSRLLDLERVGFQEMRLPWRSRVISRDTVVVFGFAFERTIVEAHLAFEIYRATTFGRTDIALVARYRLPDGVTDLVILSFFGTYFEGGYETWVPVFVPHVSHDRGNVESTEFHFDPVPVFDVKWRGAP